MEKTISYKLKCNQQVVLDALATAVLNNETMIFYEDKIKVIFDLLNNTIIRETDDYIITIKHNSNNIEYIVKKNNYLLNIETNKIVFNRQNNRVEVIYVIKDSNEIYSYELLWE